MPQQIQVAFQGGGARFIEMLPIAHALSAAHKNRTIRITRVAGSSAGSICAALIACNADFDKVRSFIEIEGLGRSRRMRRWCSTPGDLDTSLVTGARFAVALLRSVFGVSLLRTSVLVDFLTDLFVRSMEHPDSQGSGGKVNPSAQNDRFDLRKINNAPNGIKLVITGSDLFKGEGVVFEEGNLIEKIAHSSAIPFAFRAYKDIAVSPIVDGGLCENLPAEQLLKFEDQDGPVFCVSIADNNETGYVPKDMKQYCNQLISASMNHNVLRSKRLVGFSNLFEAKTALTTFDFEGAVKKIKDDDWYQESREAADSKIDGIAQLYSSVVAPSPADTIPSSLSGRLSAPKIMSALYKVFSASIGLTDWEFKRFKFIVRAECLKLPAGKKSLASPDYMVRISTVKAREGNLSCFSSSAHLDQEGSIVPTKWTCYNETQKKGILIQPVPVMDPVPGSVGMVRVLIFFEDPSNCVAKDDVLTIKSYYLRSDAMVGLAGPEKSDHIQITNGHGVPIEESDVVLVYPTLFGQILAVGTNREPVIKEEVIRSEYLLDANEGYSAIGCRATNLSPNASFRVDFFKKP
jgi:predicted acylesterase/phospholipase RssA